MRNSKLYSILEKLDRIEQNRLRKYLQSPYFNADQTIVDLFELLFREINGEENVNLEKEVVWAKLHLDKAYDDVRFRKYCSDLLKLTEGFLAQQLYDKDQVTQADFLLEAIRRKKLNKLKKSAIRKAKRLLEKTTSRSGNFFLQKFRIEKRIFDLSGLETKLAQKANAEAISDNLDYFYFGEKLRIFNFKLSQERITHHNYKINHIKDILEIVKSGDFENIPPVALYYHISLTYTDSENERHYYKLKELLEKHVLKFSVKEAKEEIYNSALNYCSRKANLGNQKFLGELLDLYKGLLEKEIIFDEGLLSPVYFRNIIVAGLRLGEYQWTEYFIKKYQNTLPKRYRENAVSFNLATLYFYQKEYPKVIRMLQTVEYEDLTYNLNSKAMLLATYYEMDEIEPLYSLFESFRVYLNRNKGIPENRRRNFKNLIKYTKKLTKVIPGDDKSIDKLKKEIDTTKNIASIGWLKEKITELEG